MILETNQLMTSVKGKFLSDFPNIVREIDLNKHTDIDVSKIQAGSNKILNWICIFCKEGYQRNVNSRVRSNCCCPKKECILLKRSKTNNEKFGWTPKYNLDKRVITSKKEIPEPSENDIEIWKDLPPELLLSKYQVSNLGRIKNKRTQYILTQNPRKDGYISNSLSYDDNTTKSAIVHILIAKTFLDNPNNKPTVNHINMNRSDNRVINLEWATHSEQSFKENKKEFKLPGKSVNQYDLDGKFIKTWDKAIDAENELNISRKNILKVLKGERKQSGGFIWKYNIENTSLHGELWKECPLGTDFPKVLTSNLGRVKIKDNNPRYGTLRKNGYYDIKINKKTFRVHRLVCLTFLENPDSKPFVNHKDENRSNNKIDNLEWITAKDNVNHSLNLNNRIKQNKRSKIVIQIDPNTNKIIKEFHSISVASKETKANYNSISWCCKKFRGHVFAGGYKWSYKV
jgi:hypothetical protein